MLLQDIYIYPIKSLGGIRLPKANLEERGLQWDRRWMLVDGKGDFLTQRVHPSMALLQVELRADGLLVFHKQDPTKRINIPFTPQSEATRPVTVWDDTVLGQEVSKEVDAWFSEILGMPCGLVWMPPSTERKIDAKYAVNSESVGFADAMPYLLIGQSALDDLNARLQSPVPMDRFRPNLVFSGGPAYIDDTWDKVKIGDALFKITKPCARCVLTTVDQATAQKGKEPLRTLSTYRTVGSKVLFGQNMLLLEGASIEVGAAVEGIPFL
ncbi:MOSC domain-containing protein [Mariniradius sediminis]|uniref:MOSC domain-containing protein n=1 Tax=Mariniradius sediminis TaxID=2909237 RepID=A0ABS9BYI7_9BACT|nr:MOSC N-terminal beta barrel domain-containing protein [Mariniradius sediminis]MCF1752759.1 MOSC domain-containing protein [Mariniradius sediminis]